MPALSPRPPRAAVSRRAIAAQLLSDLGADIREFRTRPKCQMSPLNIEHRPEKLVEVYFVAAFRRFWGNSLRAGPGTGVASLMESPKIAEMTNFSSRHRIFPFTLAEIWLFSLFGDLGRIPKGAPALAPAYIGLPTIAEKSEHRRKAVFPLRA